MADAWTRHRPAPPAVDVALLLAVLLALVAIGGLALLAGLVAAQDAVRVCVECRR